MFEAIVFAVIVLEFRPRCAWERDTGTQDRLRKITDLIGSCDYGIHDISHMRVDPKIRLPRFNMVLELGLYLGCSEFGGGRHAGKSCLIMDRDPYRYRKSISDLSGRDIQGHNGKPEKAIELVRDWLVTESKAASRPGGLYFVKQYERFRKELPSMCADLHRKASKLSYSDYCEAVDNWLLAKV